MYVPSNRKVFSLYNVVFEKGFSSELSYTSKLYSEAMEICQAVMYTPYDMSFKKQTGDVITFALFEEGGILTETRNDTEISDEPDSKSLMMNEQDMEILIKIKSPITILYLWRR